MAHFASTSQSKGQSPIRPPYFDGTNFNYWKKKMSIYLMQDSILMQVIKKETMLANEEKMETRIMEERSMEINTKAMNTLICALCLEEFNMISTYKITKEIWDKLEVTHEGTSQVK